jgi:lipoprotein
MRTPPTKCSFQAALALTLLACSGLAGCSDSQEQSASSADSKAAVATAQTKTPNTTAKATDTSTATGTPSTTVSPTATLSPELEAARKQARDTQPPPKPELITVNSDDGAIATAKYWVQLYYYIYTTGKVDEYKELCPGNGSIATKPVEDATRNQSEGGWIAPVTLKFTAAFRRSDFKNDVVIQVDFDREGVNHYDSDGKIEYHPKQSRYAGVKLEYNGSQWIVKEAFNRED